MKKTAIPQELKKVIGEQEIDFCVFAQKKMSLGKSIAGLIFGVVFISIPAIMIYTSWENIFHRGETPDVFMIIFGGMFGLFGLFSLVPSVTSFFQNGGYFVGTPSKLYHYKNQNITYYDYSAFLGICEISTREKSLTYTLKGGEYRKRKNQAPIFECYKIEMVGIPNFLEIDKIIQQRIAEKS